MVDKISIKPQIIEGFEAYKAGSELYLAVAEGTAKKFGKDSLAYETIMNGIDVNDVTGSQFFFNTQVGLYLPKGQRVVTFNDLERINNAKPDFFDGTFSTDTSGLVLRSAIPTRSRDKVILENLVGQARERGLEFSSENPLIISGATLVEDKDNSNSYGLILDLDSAKVVNDQRFAHGNNTIYLGKSRRLWTQTNGLSSVCLHWDGDVYSGDDDSFYSDSDNLFDSEDGGRVVVFDSVDVADENSEFDNLRSQYKTDLRSLRSKINRELEE